MIAVRGLVVCVDYDDLLEVTLSRNARHLIDTIVITSPRDLATPKIVAKTPNARIYTTDAFYRGGASFNKGAAIEEVFDAVGREGWWLIWDADILLPDYVDFGDPNPDRLYGAKRRLLVDVSQWQPGFSDWGSLPISIETGWPGYFQLFHGAAPRLRKRPWYGLTSDHAGYGDAYFQNHWTRPEKDFLPFEVLHLGPRDTNWYGRVSPRLNPINAASNCSTSSPNGDK